MILPKQTTDSVGSQQQSGRVPEDTGILGASYLRGELSHLCGAGGAGGRVDTVSFCAGAVCAHV